MGTEESRILAFYGMDRVRFLRPVFIGDTIHLEGEVTALEEKDADARRRDRPPGDRESGRR